MRIYDPRIGKFLSVDPISNEYPELTPYQFASNTPIQAVDMDGLESAYLVPGAVGKYQGAYMMPAGDNLKRPVSPQHAKLLPRAGNEVNEKPGPVQEAFDVFIGQPLIALNTIVTGKNGSGKDASAYDYTTAVVNILTLKGSKGKSPKANVPKLNVPKISEPELPKTVYNNEKIYRGADNMENPFEMSPADLNASVNTKTGFMKERGVSINLDKNNFYVQQKGGAWEVDINTIPSELKITHTKGTHFEITPREAGKMSLDRYQELLKTVKVKPSNTTQ